MDELKARYERGEIQKTAKKEAQDLSEIRAYKSASQVPKKDLVKGKIHVDERRNVVLLPFKDKFLPIHMMLIKSASYT